MVLLLPDEGLRPRLVHRGREGLHELPRAPAVPRGQRHGERDGGEGLIDRSTGADRKGDDACALLCCVVLCGCALGLLAKAGAAAAPRLRVLGRLWLSGCVCRVWGASVGVRFFRGDLRGEGRPAWVDSGLEFGPQSPFQA